MAKTTTHQARETTSWAAGTITRFGGTLHPIPEREGGGWDIETPDGWRTANNWRELAALAHEIAEAHWRIHGGTVAH